MITWWEKGKFPPFAAKLIEIRIGLWPLKASAQGGSGKLAMKAPPYCCHCEHCAALLCLSKKGIPEFSLFNFTDLITVGIRAKQLHPTAANEARRDLLLRLAALRAKSSLRLKHQLMCLSGNGTLWFASTKIRSLLPIWTACLIHYVHSSLPRSRGVETAEQSSRRWPDG